MSSKEYWITKASVIYDEVVKDHLTGKPGEWGPVEIRMITCKECKYWGRDFQKYCGPPGFHDCNNEKFIYEGTKCESVQRNCLVYQDNEGYAAGFSTGPDFGCIHGEN